MLSALLAAGAVVLGVPLALMVFQDRLIFFPQALSEARREAIERAFPFVRQVFVDSRDGTRLHAWHVPGEPGAPLVLYFGGNAEDVSWMIPQAAESARGIGWLLTSYRGYGASEGAPSERALSADAVAWHDHATTKLGAKAVYVFGRSLGSGPAVTVASRREVAGLILVTPFDSLVDVAKRHYPFLPVGLMLRHRFDSVRLAPAMRSPLLCIAAQDDEVVPAVHARRLYDAWGGPKRWVELKGAGHNSTDGVPQFWHSIRAFLEQSGVQQ